MFKANFFNLFQANILTILQEKSLIADAIVMAQIELNKKIPSEEKTTTTNEVFLLVPRTQTM